MRRAALALAAIALGGCETTAEKSAKLEAAAKRAAGTGGALGARGLHIARASAVARVTATAVLHSPEGTAAVVSIRNSSESTLRNVPVQITVRDVHGAAIYSNTAPGLGSALISASEIPARGVFTWVDDQIQVAGAPATVSAVVGQSSTTPGSPPQLAVAGAHLTQDPSAGAGAAGTLVNRSKLSQREVVVYAVARRGSRVVAAGRAVLPEVPAGASTAFQLFFIGNPDGAQLEVSAPATTFG